MVTAGGAKPCRNNLHELKKCLQTAQDAERCRGRELRARVGDSQFVGFVFAEFLDSLATFVGMNLQCGGRHQPWDGMEFRFAARADPGSVEFRCRAMRRGFQ